MSAVLAQPASHQAQQPRSLQVTRLDPTTQQNDPQRMERGLIAYDDISHRVRRPTTA